MTDTIVGNNSLPIFVGSRLTQTDALSASNSDDVPVNVSNRGQKLKRKAQFIHEGQLGAGKFYKRVCPVTYNKKLMQPVGMFP